MNRFKNQAPYNLKNCFGFTCPANYLSQNRNVAGSKPFLFKNRNENLAPSNLKNCFGLKCLSKYLSQNRNVAGSPPFLFKNRIENLAPSNLKNCFGLKCLSKYLTKTNLYQNRNVVGTETFLFKNCIEIQEPSNLKNCFGKMGNHLHCIDVLHYILRSLAFEQLAGLARCSIGSKHYHNLTTITLAGCAKPNKFRLFETPNNVQNLPMDHTEPPSKVTAPHLLFCIFTLFFHLCQKKQAQDPRPHYLPTSTHTFCQFVLINQLQHLPMDHTEPSKATPRSFLFFNHTLFSPMFQKKQAPDPRRSISPVCTPTLYQFTTTTKTSTTNPKKIK